MLNNVLRLFGMAQPATWAPALVPFRTCSSLRPDDLRGTSKPQNVWDQVLRSAQSSPEKLRDIVDTLTKHCIITNTAPPLEAYNELLRICHLRSDVALIQKLVHMGYTVNMHFNETTHQRFYSSFNLQSSSQNYFTRPFHGSLHSSGSVSNSTQNGSAAGTGQGAGVDAHGFGRVGFVQAHQSEGHNQPQARQQQHGQQQQQQPGGWRVYDRHGTPGTHGGRMDD